MIIIGYSIVFQISFLVLLCIILCDIPRINIFVKISLMHMLHRILSKSLLLVLVALNLMIFFSREPVFLSFADFFSLSFASAFLLLILICTIFFRWVFRRVVQSPVLSIHGKFNGNTQPLSLVIQQYLDQKNIEYKEVELRDFQYYVLQQDDGEETPFLCLQKNKPKLGYFNAYDIFFKASTPWITNQDFEKIMKLIYQIAPRKKLYYFFGAIYYLIAVILFLSIAITIVTVEYLFLFHLGSVFLVIYLIVNLIIFGLFSNKDASPEEDNFFPKLLPHQSLSHQHFNLYSLRKQSLWYQ